MLTKEEKAQRRQERIQANKERDNKFPGAFYSPRNLQVVFKRGESWSFSIRTNDLDQFKPCRIGGDHGWVEAYVPMNDIGEVSELAAAIIARLNALIDDANEDIRKCNARSLEKPHSVPQEDA